MEAYVTLATTDAYALGALVLAQSIRQVGTTRKLVVMITKSLSDLIRSLSLSHSLTVSRSETNEKSLLL